MEVILLEKVRNLGNLGDKVSVKAGYGRNFLIPYGKAAPANEKNLADFEERRAELEAKAKLAHENAEKRALELAKLTVSVPARAGDEGKLFGSISTRDIAAAITTAGVKVEKHEVLLPQGQLRYLGDYDIEIQLHSDVTTTIKVNVVEEE